MVGAEVEVTTMRRVRLAIALGLSAGSCTHAWAGTPGFLTGEEVQASREQTAEMFSHIAVAFETPGGIWEPRERATILAQAASTTSNNLTAWEGDLQGDPVGDRFLADGAVLVRCLARAMTAEPEAQVDWLKRAASFWRLELSEPLSPEMCGL
jgi:hypothetical protein